MKQIIITLVAVVTLFSCSPKQDNPYVTLQGNINNSEQDSITILGRNFKKVIQVEKDGTFKDTLKVTDGFHSITDGTSQSFMYLRNGYDMQIDLDMNDFPEAVAYQGKGAKTNNYLGKKIQFIKDEKITDYGAFFQLDKDEFDMKIAELKSKLAGLLNETEGLDDEVAKMEKESNDKLIIFFQSNYEKEHNRYVGLMKGDPSPTFIFEDQFGKKVSLEDLKGQFVYIDVWATWCAPCMMEIPYLKKIDEEYNGKNIAFVSLSIDKVEQKDKWLKMIKDKELKGIQLIADNAFDSEFIEAYKIDGIPRFILIDPEGNILDSNAPRPSDPQLKQVLNTLQL